MNLTATRDRLAMRTKYILEFEDNELTTAKLYDWDRALIADVQTSQDVTVADRLLVLEMLARRIEESA